MSRAIILTSTFQRHRFVVNRIADVLDVVGVWQEGKSFQPERYARTSEEAAVIEHHFHSRDVSEAACFRAETEIVLGPRGVHRVVPPQACNEPAEVDMMRRLNPDVVLVFGTGILKPLLIDAFRGHIINLHLGLSPYYRGAGTNFWPLVNREPEYVGATIHYLDEGIDTGPIIGHVRPDVHATDGPHDLGNRTIVAAVELMSQAAVAHTQGDVVRTPQSGSGRLYQRKDFSADAVRQLYRQFETGMIAEYLREKTERDARVPLRVFARTAGVVAPPTSSR